MYNYDAMKRTLIALVVIAVVIGATIAVAGSLDDGSRTDFGQSNGGVVSS